MANLGWFTSEKQVAGAEEYGMFSQARQTAENPPVKKTGMTVQQMTPQLQAIFKRSLKSNRWDAINLGPNSAYTNDNMIDRWNTEKNKWLQRQPERDGPNAEPDVRGEVTSGPIPEEQTARHDKVKRTMKQTSGPYAEFQQYHPLEDTVLLYDEIWNESSSDE